MLQQALVERDRDAIRRLLAESPRLRVETGDGFSVGTVFPHAAERTVVVLGPTGVDAELGHVTASLPLDESLAGRLRDASGLPEGGRVVVVQESRIVAGPRAIGGALELPTGRPSRVSIGGTGYRGLAAGAAGGVRGVSVAVLLPQSGI